MGRRLKRGGAATATLGLVALGAAFVRMGTLVDPSPTPPSWQLTLGAAFAVGAVVAVAGRFARLRLAGSIALGLVVAASLMGRLAAPESLWLGLLPVRATWDVLAAQLAEGLEFLRYGTAPLPPYESFILLLVPAFFSVGFGWGWLAAEGRGLLAAVVPGGLYLAVAIADQTPSGAAWVVGAAVWVGLVLAVSGWEETTSTPRILGKPGRAGIVVAGVLVVVVGLVATDLTERAVPHSGSVPWRDAGAFGAGSGRSLNLYASTVQTDLVNRSEEVLFSARVAGNVDPARLYWPLVTLDRYDGVVWSPTNAATRRNGAGVMYERTDHRYLGSTERVNATVRIDGLRMQALPYLYSVTSLEGDTPLIQRGVRARDDGALFLDSRTRQNLVYSIEADVPADGIVDVALGADGTLPELFERAQSEGAISLDRTTGTGSGSEPTDLARFTDLPIGLDPSIAALAAVVTDGATEPIEQLYILENYFRHADFVYDVAIDPGHAASDLAAWLSDPESPNYRRGYCEQFATAMGVMARSLGIPTRLVLGFGPGTVTADGIIEVRGRNAHSWVEAWIDGVGWVRFDPTPRSAGDTPSVRDDLGGLNLARFIDDEVGNPLSTLPDSAPIIFNPDDEADDRLEFLGEDVATPDALPDTASSAAPFSIPGEVWWVLVAAVGVVGIPIAKWVRRRRRLARARHGDISAAWAEITDRLADLDRPVHAAMTPAEIAASTTPDLVPLAAAHGRASWSAAAPSPAESERALESFERTETTLRSTTPLARRIIATWRPRSLMRRR